MRRGELAEIGGFAEGAQLHLEGLKEARQLKGFQMTSFLRSHWLQQPLAHLNAFHWLKPFRCVPQRGRIAAQDPCTPLPMVES